MSARINLASPANGPTRRQVIAGVAVAFGGLTVGSTEAWAGAEFDGYILGRHLELVPNERIVQAWRVAYWAPGIYAIAKFDLVEQGPRTKIVFDHRGFPNGDGEHLAAGWKANYGEPLEKFLA